MEIFAAVTVRNIVVRSHENSRPAFEYSESSRAARIVAAH
jgi:hypothetical protein